MMATSSYRGLMLVVIALPLLFGEANVAAGEEPEIEKLVRDLRDRNFRVRQSAMRRLTELDAVEALRKALHSDDPEIARLAGLALKDLEKLDVPGSLQKLKREIADGKASLAIDRFARWNGPENDKMSWQLMIDFAWDITKRATKKHPVLISGWFSKREPIRSTKTFDGYRLDPWELLFIHSRNRFVLSELRYGCVRAEGIEAMGRGYLKGVLVSSDGIRLRLGGGSQSQSILFISGQASVTEVSDTILICDGDLQVDRTITTSIVVAKSVKCFGASNSVIAASGSITSRQAKDPTASWLENEPNPFGFIKWFTVAEVGLEVAAASDAVKIEKLHDGKLPRKAGLELGDVITAVDGTKVDSPESFRRRLLRGVVNEYCTLTVRRGGKSLDVPLDFRAEERAKEKVKQAEKK